MKFIEIYNNLQEYISEFHEWCEGKTKPETDSFADGWGLPNDSEIDGEIDEKNPPKSIPLNVCFTCLPGIRFSCVITYVSDDKVLLEYIVAGNEMNMKIQNIERLG